jgi:hypothetical protein
MATAFLLALAGCAVIPENDKAILVQGPDCSDPEAQIAAVAALRPSQFKKARVMAGYVSPDGLISGAINNDFSDRRKIVNGTYGREIDAKIIAIQSACGRDPLPLAHPAE